ncbi:TPA: hypothetical protein ACH3X1_006494 [Trebouxia sp. C0004]
MARPRPTSLNRNALSRATLAQSMVLVLTVTLVCALLVVSGRRQHAGSYDLPRTPGFTGADGEAGHEIRFLESQQNLKHSNLMEVSIEDSNKIFKGRPFPDTGSNSIDLTKNGDGFLSNVQEANKGAVETYETATASGDAKPLGFYFSKDIPHHVKEKALGMRSKMPSIIPSGGKAALGLYFNQDSTQSEELDSSDTRVAGQIGSSDTASQYRSMSEEQQLPGSTADVTADMDGKRSGVTNIKHRKELQGISLNAQPRQETSLDQGQAQSLPANRKGKSEREDLSLQEADDMSRSSLVIAVNSPAGQIKPSKKRTFLNTADM